MRASRLVTSAASTRKAFARVTADDIAFFRSLDPKMVVTDREEVAPFTVDWMRKYRSTDPSLVLRPRDTQTVSRVLAHCNARRLAVVPQGGNTGLVGGSVPVHDEIVLSLQRMNRMVSIDVESNVASCEAGVVLEALETALAPYGMTLPIDLGAKGSCHVGGNVATNAGGVHLLRYGNLHGSVLGLEVVQADGTVLDLDTHLRKDNTGFDLKQLFIGSEGTLGVITRVTLAVPPLPRSRSVAFLACDSFAQVRAMLRAAKQELGEVLSAFEMMDSLTVDLVVKHIPNVPNPLAQPSAFYVLVEVAGSNASHDEQKLAAFTERVLGHGTASDGILAQDVTQMRALWRVREAASQATLRAGGFPFKYDLSLPLDHYYAIVEKVRERVGSSGVVIGYGHVGDSNLHLNVASNDAAVVNQIEPFVWEYCRSHRGSISAEHGVGLQKVAKLHYSKSPAAIAVMRQMKQIFDPNGILNPYKVVPDAQ